MWCSMGKISVPICSAKAMITMLASVPKPGRCLSGIQPSKTTMLMKKVDHPSENGECLLIPCDKTLHGAFPSVDWMSSASPNPKIVKPKNRMSNRGRLSDHGDDAVQLVLGIVRCGLNRVLISIMRSPNPNTLPGKLGYELQYLPLWCQGRPVPCCERE